MVHRALCDVCLEDVEVERMRVLHCGHCFCRVCTLSLRRASSPACPTCSAPVANTSHGRPGAGAPLQVKLRACAPPLDPAAYDALTKRARGVKAAVRGMMSRTTEESVDEANQAIKGALRNAEEDCCSTDGLVDVVKIFEETMLTLFTRLRMTEADLVDLREEVAAAARPQVKMLSKSTALEPHQIPLPAPTADENCDPDLSGPASSAASFKTVAEDLTQPSTSSSPTSASAPSSLPFPIPPPPSTPPPSPPSSGPLLARIHALESQLARAAHLESEAAAANAFFVDFTDAREENARLRARVAELERRGRELERVERERREREDDDVFAFKARHKNLHTTVWLKRPVPVPVWLPPKSASSTSSFASSASSSSNSDTQSMVAPPPVTLPATFAQRIRRPSTRG